MKTANAILVTTGVGIVVIVVLVASTNVEIWHGWDWHFWDPLVAIGTLALAGATIHLAISTKRLAIQTAREIAESHRVRRADSERRHIERIYDETLNVVEVLGRSELSALNVPDLEISQRRLSAAITVAGGPERWPQADLLTRPLGGDLNLAALIRQSDGALREIEREASAVDAD